MRNARTSSGSAVSGACRLRTTSGFRAAGTRCAPASSGRAGSGSGRFRTNRLNRKSNTCRRRRPRSNWGRTSRLPMPRACTSRVRGCGAAATSGVPDSGSITAPTGSGCPPTSAGRPSATSSSTATGTTQSPHEACSSRPCISRTATSHKATTTRRNTWSLSPCSSGRSSSAADIRATTSATTTTTVIRAAATNPGAPRPSEATSAADPAEAGTKIHSGATTASTSARIRSGPGTSTTPTSVVTMAPSLGLLIPSFNRTR